MSKHLLVLKQNPSERLKSARDALGLKLADLASSIGVSKATQYNYENGQTSPDLSYLLKVEKLGLDVPYVLFGLTDQELQAGTGIGNHIDWTLLQQAFEDVEFFCVRHAPSCPSSYRWKLVARLYDALQVAKTNGSSSSADHIGLINEMWEES